MVEQVDYKRLLVIYMDYVGEHESTDFMGHARPSWIDEGDWAELERISQESSISGSKPPGLGVD